MMQKTEFDRAQEHSERLLDRIRRAQLGGKKKLVRRLVIEHLRSYDAKLSATRRALVQLDLPADEGASAALAKKLNPWIGSTEPVKVISIPKGSAGHRRIITEFGPENKALQYLVQTALVATAELHPHQYGSLGVQAAVLHAAKTMVAGGVWAVEVDIEDCFPSFKEEDLSNLLLLPKEVIRHVVMASHLNLVSGNLHDVFGPAEGGDDPFLVTASLANAQRGIPQGSAASNIVAEILLSAPFYTVPGNGTAIGYADNTLLMASTEEIAASITSAFGGALKAHLAGRLRPKIKGMFMPGEPIKFIGHQLSLGSGGVKIEPTQKNRARFHQKTSRMLKQVANASSKSAKRRSEKKLTQYVNSWCGSFRLCAGVGALRIAALSKLSGTKAHQN